MDEEQAGEEERLPENLKKYLEAKKQQKVEVAATPEEIKETAPAKRTKKKA